MYSCMYTCMYSLSNLIIECNHWLLFSNAVKSALEHLFDILRYINTVFIIIIIIIIINNKISPTTIRHILKWSPLI